MDTEIQKQISSKFNVPLLIALHVHLLLFYTVLPAIWSAYAAARTASMVMTGDGVCDSGLVAGTVTRTEVTFISE